MALHDKAKTPERQVGKNRHFRQAFGHATDGIKDVLHRERNMRFHLLAAGLVVILGLWLKIGRSDWLWLTLAISMVIMSEFVNTMIEALVDLIVKNDYSPSAKIAKDVAAGGVLVAAMTAVIIGGLIFYPYLF